MAKPIQYCKVKKKKITIIKKIHPLKKKKIPAAMIYWGKRDQPFNAI